MEGIRAGSTSGLSWKQEAGMDKAENYFFF